MTSTDPLGAVRLAAYLDVPVFDVSNIGLADSDVRQLTKIDAGAWSAITVVGANREAIIFNPANSPRRLSNDIMHELSHLLLGHEPNHYLFCREPRIGTSRVQYRG